ncbi:hypothetical protein SDJN03_07813, partial [Cucurbita argyrosperma subsp. sororia]
MLNAAASRVPTEICVAPSLFPAGSPFAPSRRTAASGLLILSVFCDSFGCPELQLQACLERRKKMLLSLKLGMSF